MRIDFNLNRRVPDAEMLLQFIRKLCQKLVAGMAGVKALAAQQPPQIPQPQALLRMVGLQIAPFVDQFDRRREIKGRKLQVDRPPHTTQDIAIR